MQKRIKDLLEKINADAMLICDEYNMRYLSGAVYEGFFFATKEKSYILTDARYTEVATSDSKGAEVIELTSSYPEIVKSLIQKYSIKRLAFEDMNMTYANYNIYSKLGAEMVMLTNSVEMLRVIKNEYELENLKRAEHIGDLAFSHIINFIKPGMTEMEIAIELENTMKKNGADNLSFDTIVASGINGSRPHAVPGQKKVQVGEFITMDFGCKYNGYCSDMTRTVMLGKANDEQRKIYSTVLQAQLAGLAALKAGVKACEIDKISRDIIAEAGYGKYFSHSLGHGVGLFIHEYPSVSAKSDAVLQENIIVTVEPGIYIPGFGGVRIEDMLVVKNDGYINFANSPKELIEI